MPKIVRSTLLIGLEVHVELATRSKMFSRSPSPACPEFDDADPNTLIDPVVLGLPGALPVMNKAALDMAMSVGMALGCQIAEFTKWDRKNYYYPDLPKAYQISQYDLPICFDGALDAPVGEPDEDGQPTTKRIGIIRAHLEEDAGKLLHEAPGGRAIDFSIVDYNRAGTPLLEIVTQPDFRSADEVVRFAQLLRHICRWLGVTEGVMQKGHMRFEPNINMHLELDDGKLVKTPIVEIKNLNSFRAVKGAIEFEQQDQPRRWMEDGRVMGPGAKRTRGWDDVGNRTVVQREKEDAHEYRYFPDPDLVPVVIDAGWKAQIEKTLPELPHEREARHREEYGLSAKESAALNDERANSDYFERCVEELAAMGVLRDAAGKKVANVLLQSGAKRANERDVLFSRLGPEPAQVARLVKLREDGKIGSSAMDELFGLLCDGPKGADPEAIARDKGLLQVSDAGAVEQWVDQVLKDPANQKAIETYKGGKVTVIGALVGAVMKQSKGQADAKLVREMLEKKLA